MHITMMIYEDIVVTRQPTRQKQATLGPLLQEQGGYFTAKQALSAGYSYDDQHYRVRTGDWVRVDRGIYRATNYPSPERADLIVATLLSHDRSGEPQAVVSHETALGIFEISDANPARVHLTAPPGFRKQMHPNIVLYKANLAAQDWEQRDGYRVTTPLRTILDTAKTPAIWPYLADAIEDALRKGLVRASQLALAASKEKDAQVQSWLLSALDVAEHRTERKGAT